MLISYAITVCNEFDEIKYLIETLTSYKHINDEIVVLFDSKNGSNQVYEYLTSLSNINCIVSEKFNNDFSEWKNILNENCNGDYILQLDADECIDKDFISNIPLLIKSNQNIDLFYFPRINIVDGVTLKEIGEWDWNITKSDNFITEKIINNDEYLLLKKYDLILQEEGSIIKYYIPIINRPDYQGRLYKNNLKWVGKVHENVIAQNIGILPDEEPYSILHKKNIKKQIQQNNLYKQIENENA